MNLDHEIWRGLVWDPTNRRMITVAENRNVARKVMFYAAGGNLGYLKTSMPSLVKELSGLLGKEEQEISVPVFVTP